MKKRTKIMLIIILILIAIPLVVITINKLQTFFSYKSYPEASKATSPHFKIIKIPFQGEKLDYNFITMHEDMKPGKLQADDARGHVYWDTLSNNFLIRTTEFVLDKDRGGYDERKHYITISPEGKIINDNTGDYDKDLFKNMVLLNDRMLPFQKWKDKSQEIYLSHFSMDKFSSHGLNPLRGIGSPTGMGPAYPWEGHGYYHLSIGGEKLKFKLPCKMEGYLFSEDYEYNTGLYYYRLPEAASFGKNIAFLAYDNKNEHSQLYMIMPK